MNDMAWLGVVVGLLVLAGAAGSGWWIQSRLTEVQRMAAGITQGMVRVAVGLEHPGDLQADLNRGLGTLP